MKRLPWLIILMVVTLLIITGFQVYWLHSNYEREATTLRVTTNALFKQTIDELQSAHLKFDTIRSNKVQPPLLKNITFSNVIIRPTNSKHVNDSATGLSKQAMVRLTRSLSNRLNSDTSLKASGKKNTFFISLKSTNGFNVNDSSLNKTIDLNNIDPNSIRSIVVLKGNSKTKNDSSSSTYNAEMLQHLVSKKMTEAFTDSNKNILGLVQVKQPSTAKKKNNITFKKAPGAIINDYNIVLRITSPLDSLPLKDLKNSFSKVTSQKHLNVPFFISRIKKNSNDTLQKEDEVTVGFEHPVNYRLQLGNTFPYLIRKISVPIIFSLFLVGVTLLSFIAFYRNAVKQQRLALTKNEFISNITHELKTPIATVGVAIEALRNFNALHDKERTEEYLNISEGELNRLSLLVDKVLTFSMFEQNKMALQLDTVDIKTLVEEVVVSLRMQLDKAGATLYVKAEGNTKIKGDKMHLESVIFNLLDNAIKYNDKKPVIEININGRHQQLQLSVKDNGPGIAKEYIEKVFDKFFRVPSQNRHNVKGYGLGLSYAAHIIQQHKGTIRVESSIGHGSNFIINLPC